jgi:hypothetical protein
MFWTLQKTYVETDYEQNKLNLFHRIIWNFISYEKQEKMLF